MSCKTLKTFAPNCLRKAKLTYNTISDIAGRFFYSARPKEVKSFVEHGPTTTTSRAHLTARCPYSLTKSLSGVIKQDDRPLPEHEPDPFAYMTPLRPVKPLTWPVKQETLNQRTVKDWKLEDRANASSQERITQRLVDLLQQQYKVDSKDSLEDCEDRRCYRSTSGMNMEQSKPRRNFRLEENHQEAERTLAQNLGPPETPKPFSQESQARPMDSATYVVTSRFLNKSPSYLRLQQAPRFTSTAATTSGKRNVPPYGSFATPLSTNATGQSIMNTVRPDYQEAPRAQPKQSHPINVVRPDIPPLSTAPKLSVKVLQPQKARKYQVELSEEEEEDSARTANCVAWIRRKLKR